MANQVRPLQESFNAGEFGGRMLTRVQFDKYVNAGSVYENILPLPQGGWTARPGLRYIASAKSTSVKALLVRFVYSTTQAYMMELGNASLRFYRNQGQIVGEDIGSSITNGTFGSDIASWTDRSNGTGALAHDATNNDMELRGAGSGNEAIAEQAPTTTTTGTEHVLAFDIKGSAGDPLIIRIGSSSGGGEYLADISRTTGYHTIQFTPAASPYYIQFENNQNKTISIDNIALFDTTAIELTTPWAEADLPNIGYAQTADVMYWALGGSTRPYRLDRFGHASWSLSQVLFSDGPFLDENTSATTLTLGATTGNGVSLTASAITGINDGAGFRATDVGRVVRWKDAAGNWTWFQIVGYTSTTVVTIDIKGPDASATTATTSWRLGMWNDTDGWPSVVSFVQQRSTFAATTTYPQQFWMSKSADLENMEDESVTGTVLDDNSISYRFAATQVNSIRWIASRKKPIIGTQGGEWTLRSQGAVLTPTDVAADLEVSAGVAKVAPLEIRNRLVFLQAQGRKLNEFADVFTESGVSGFDAFDLTLLNDRVLKGGVSQIAYQSEPDSIIWTVRKDGQAPTLTYQPEQSVVGWARQICGGSFLGGDAVIESVAAIPGQDGAGQVKSSAGRHEVWMIVKRTINGATARYVECLEAIHDNDEYLQEDAFYVDSGLSLDNPKTVTGATAAYPVVVTSTAHGLSDGDDVRIVRVSGMTELNGNSYKLGEVTTNTFELAAIDGPSVTAITRANPGSVTSVAHGLSTNDEVHFHGVGGMTEVNGNGYTVTKVNADTFTIGVDTSAFTTFTTAGKVYPATDGRAYTAYTTGGEARLKVSSVSGLSHLEGETVSILGDGAVLSTATVSSGAVTLSSSSSVVHVGLAYTRLFKSLKLAFGGQNGTAVGRPKTITDVTAVLMETAEGALAVSSIDTDGTNAAAQLELRQADNIDGDAVPLFTGEVLLGIESGFDQDVRIELRGSTPVPATVLGLVPELETSE